MISYIQISFSRRKFSRQVDSISFIAITMLYKIWNQKTKINSRHRIIQFVLRRIRFLIDIFSQKEILIGSSIFLLKIMILCIHDAIRRKINLRDGRIQCYYDIHDSELLTYFYRIN